MSDKETQVISGAEARIWIAVFANAYINREFAKAVAMADSAVKHMQEDEPFKLSDLENALP